MKQTNQQPADGDGGVRRQLEPAEGPAAGSENQGGSRLESIAQTAGERLSGLGRQLKDSAARRVAMIRGRLENESVPDSEPVAPVVRRGNERKQNQPGNEGIRPVRMQPAARDWHPAPTGERADAAAKAASGDAGAADAKMAGDRIEPASAVDSTVPNGETRRMPRVVQPMAAGRIETGSMDASGAATATFAAERAADMPETAAPDQAGREGIQMSGTYIDLTQPSAVVLPGGSIDADADRTGPLTGLREAIGQTVRAYRKRRTADRSIRRNSRERVYRLKGYTTVAKVNRKFASERNQRLLRRILTVIIISLTLVLLFQLYNPIRDLSEWYRIIGIDSLDDLPNTTGTDIQSGTVTVTPPVATPSATSTTGTGTTTRATTRTTTRATTR